MSLLNIEMLYSDMIHFYLKVTNHYTKFWKLLWIKIYVYYGESRIHISEVSWGGELVEGRRKRI